MSFVDFGDNTITTHTEIKFLTNSTFYTDWTTATHYQLNCYWAMHHECSSRSELKCTNTWQHYHTVNWSRCSSCLLKFKCSTCSGHRLMHLIHNGQLTLYSRLVFPKHSQLSWGQITRKKFFSRLFIFPAHTSVIFWVFHHYKSHSCRQTYFNYRCNNNRLTIGIGRLVCWYRPIVVYTVGKYRFLLLLPKVNKHVSGFRFR